MPQDADGQAGPLPDFRIVAVSKGEWKIFILSTQARTWMRKNQQLLSCGGSTDMVRADVDGVNGLLSKARREGLKTLYVGPKDVVEF